MLSPFISKSPVAHIANVMLALFLAFGLILGPLLARETNAAAVSMSFTQQPSSAVSGAAFGTQPKVTALNPDGTVDASFVGSVTVVIKAGTGASGATITGTTTVTASAGVATFSGLQINKTGTGYILVASSGSLSVAESAAFDVTPGTATKLAFSTQPSANNTAGAPFGTQPVVIIQDGNNNTVTSSTASVTLAITSGTGTTGASLSGTATVSAASGVAIFSGLSIDIPGSGYALTATSTGLTSATSNPFNVGGVASKLAFSTSPSSSTAGVVFGTQPVVAIQDINGNVVTSSTASVTLAITSATGTSGAILSGTKTVAAVNGVATFTSLSIDKAGTGYTLTAISGTLNPALSNSFNVTVGTATKLGFVQQPSANNTAGVNFGTQPKVAIQDANGNTVSSGANITLAITSGTGTTGANLVGTATVAASSGVATFSGLSIDAAGTGYTLTATSGTLTLATSSAFNVVTLSAGLVFTTQPGLATAATAFGTQPVVKVQDSFGNTVTTGARSTASITLSITSGTGTSGAGLAGTVTLTASSGVATFSGLSINFPGSGYTLTAAASGITSATSSSFNVAAGPSKLAFTTQPSSSNTAGAAFGTQPVVTVQDNNGNTVTNYSSNVTIAITSGTGAVLSGTATVAASSGVATFSGLSINLAGSNYTLTATSSSLSPATSSAFNVAVSAASTLAFSTQPSANNTNSAAFGTQPVVTVQDANGNTVNSSAAITMAITSGTGTAGAVLGGVTTVNAVNGVATFSGLSIDLAGSGYTLRATSGTLTAATSSAFDVAGAATKVVFSTQPAGATAGTAFTTQPVVTIQDASSRTVTTSTASVTLAITTGTGASGATLSGTLTVAASGGLAIFSGLSIDKAGAGYTLTATSTGLTSAASNAFSVAVGTAAKLAFTTHPGGATAAAAFVTQPVVTVQDSSGNTVTGSSAAVTVAITSGTGTTGATLSGTLTVNAASGVATFSGLSIDQASTGSNYSLTATSSTLTSATSNGFPVAGQAAKLAFTTQPSSNNTATVAFGTQPVVTVQDSSGNTVTTSTAAITVAITSGTGTSGAILGGTATINASAGVATFSGLSTNLAGSGYTLTASSGSLTVGSAALNVAGTATKVAFTTSPSATNTPGVAFGTQPVVTVQDANGNIVTNSTAAVTVAITSGSGTSGAVLSGTVTVNASAGIATFSGLKIDLAGTNYSLTATSGTLSPATSSLFNVAVGSANKLSFSTQASGNNTAGTAFDTQPVVVIQDSGGNTVTSSTASVTLAITSGTGTAGAILFGTATVQAVSGVATFSGLSINRVGTGYTVTATSTGLTSVTSNALNVTPGAATALVFTTQPGQVTAGAVFGAQPVVTIQDAQGNTVTSSLASITLGITSGTGTTSAVISGTNPKTAASGVATFIDIQINLPGAGYTLTATSGTLTAATSSSFNVASGVPARLAFTTQPSSSTGGVVFGTQPVVTVQDSNGNTVTTSTVSITLAITSGTGTSGATLGGTVTLTATAGVATFSSLKIDKAGTGYALAATSTGLTSATSSSFNVTVGPAVKLGFTTQPGVATMGTVFGTQPVVAIQDAGGNTVASSIAITVSITPGSGTAGAALSGTATVTAVSGVASFSGLSIDLGGNGYTLNATGGTVTPTTSNAFNVAGAASQLAFTTQPGTATAGATFGLQPVVTVQDSSGNTVTTSTASVTLAITSATGTTGATLSGTATVAAINGVATFSGLSIDFPGAGYILTATSTGLTSATSNPFSVASGVATLAFTTQPSGSNTAGTAFATQPVVKVQDVNGNTVTTSSDTITLAITSSTGTTGAVLAGTTTMNAVNGVAAFTGLNINLVGSGYTLSASSGTLGTATSSAFNVSVGTAVKVAFTTQPSADNAAGVSFGTQPVVKVQDGNGNTVTTSTASITVAITSGTGTAGASLGGTATVTATAGVVTFSGLNINLPGTGYALTATSAGLTSGASSAFNVAGSAASLSFSTQPSASNTAGANFGTQPVVKVLDSNGNLVTNSSISITLSITSGTGTSGAVLSGTLTQSASSGVATFSGLSIDKSGTGYTLRAVSGVLPAATSSALNVVVGTASKVAFTTQPSAANTAGVAFDTQPVVAVQDAGGNTVTSSTASITVAITSGTGTAGASLGGTATVTATAGVATFSGLNINLVGSGYTLTASSSGLTSAASNSMTVAGPHARLAFTTSPSNSAAGVAFGTQPVVTVQDNNGNIVTNSTAAVTVAITSGSGTSGAVLSGTTTVNAVNGVATFSGLSINLVGSGYTLMATSGTLSPATSSTFNITVSAAGKLAFTNQPGGATAGSAFVSQPVVTVLDGYGNTVTSSSAAVTIAITSGTGSTGAVLSGTATVNASSGVATFTNLSISSASSGYMLTATSSGLTSAASSAFSVTPATAATLAFTAQPGGATAGSTFVSQPVVAVLDGYGNTVTSSSAAVTIAITSGTGSTGAVLSGTATVNASSGVATFSGLGINLAGNGYTLTASGSGLAAAVSSAFGVASTTAAKLAFTTQPSASNSAGTAFATQPAVTIQDASGNTVSTASTAVTLAITSGTGTSGAVLSGTTTVNAVNGVATFSGLKIDLAGTIYTLTATSAGLTAATSSAFSVVAGPATKLGFTTQPGLATAGVAFGVQPVVVVQDAGGNTVTGSTAAVTLAIISGTGTSGATLSGSAMVTANGGIAVFSGLSINLAGSGYILLASSGALATAQSGAFTVTAGQAAKLAFATQPSSSNTASATFATQPVVAIQDINGNTVSAVGAVTLSLTSGTGASGATLSGTTTVNTVNGVATFSGLSINRAGTGYTLTATSGTLTMAVSNAFNVASAAPTTTVALSAGWNLVSLPLIPNNPAISSVLSSVNSSVIGVWYYDATTGIWHSYAPGAPADLTVMTDGKGYWINMSQAGALSYAGVELPAPPTVPPTYNVVAGWNLIGFKSTAPRTASDYLSAIAGKYTRIYGFANGSYFSVLPADTMMPGAGYWIAVTSAGTIYP